MERDGMTPPNPGPREMRSTANLGCLTPGTLSKVLGRAGVQGDGGATCTESNKQTALETAL